MPGPWGLVTNVLTLGQGGISNTVAPAIASSAVIGTTITPTAGTWTGNPVLTYQWQRNTGSWVDISGATTAARAPVDADWGYSLRLAEIPNGNAALAVYSNATGLTAEAPVQTISSELITNGDMSSATGWTAGAQWTIGSGVATAVNNTFSTLRQSILDSGEYYETGGVCVRSSGSIVHKLNTTTVRVISATVTYLDVERCVGGSNCDWYGASTANATLDNVTVKRITQNSRLVQPNADGVVAFSFTLPASPVAGQLVNGYVRISNFATGDFLRIQLKRNDANTNYDLKLQSLAALSPTDLISVSNVGSINAWRITMNGSDLTLETSADNGENWTSRGTVSSSSYATATGAHVIYSSAVTPGVLTYAPL